MPEKQVVLRARLRPHASLQRVLFYGLSSVLIPFAKEVQIQEGLEASAANDVASSGDQRKLSERLALLASFAIRRRCYTPRKEQNPTGKVCVNAADAAQFRRYGRRYAHAGSARQVPRPFEISCRPRAVAFSRDACLQAVEPQADRRRTRSLAVAVLALALG